MRAAASFKVHADRGSAARSGAKRADPPPPLFLIKGGKFEIPPEGRAEDAVLDVSKPELSAAPASALAAEGAPVARHSRKWLAAIVASCVFHAGVAALFLHFREDLVQLAGADQAGVSMAGNAAEDQAAAGELDPATNVTIIPMIQAETVEANEAEQIQPVETAETAAPAEIAEAPTTDRIEPAKEAAAEPVQPVEPLPEPAVEPLPEPAVEALSEVTPSAETPQVLATDRAEPVEDDNIVPPVEERTAEAPTEEPAVEPTEEPVVEPAENEDEATEEIARQLAQLDSVPVPAPRPEKPKTPEANTEPAAATKKQRTAERASGSSGRNQADARRGSADGAEQGNTVVASRGAKQNTAAGNAAVSNYPGKIVSKLRRALRYPAAAKRQRLRGEVHVAFTVSGSGSVSSVRVVRSSGAAVLDQAAVETVRRAAPFPPIPAEAGRSNWPFTVPLAFTR